ncbi:MAG: ABC transporter ATP-binding protein/permease [Oscillospiraceae bacterium]|jgi:putative ABC transport system permease protein|nr:ABC transporter ATP-binding protein/permease [Oscillospiraceae bacterium]
MLQIKKVCKTYVTGNLTQQALNKVTFNLRDNEFVAVLGQSGSGKTTLLNIIGGLDRYDSGDIVINDISTKRYKDRDWDSYRNHTIGFVFQSYNLIPHQSILSNVELALTISGISRKQRRKRAKEALEQVGLGEQLHKKPNQMSGGQMQRVAIARALVNDPDILLADEPTGALDSETSVQVMELLKEVAKDRLVVMVTHNSELADQYATRIIKLHDGKIVDDSDPFEVEATELAKPKHKNMGKSSMSFFTALALSFNNLRTKKARTFLTSFAGSIGIIGIALILSLSTGVNLYIESIQKDTMASYPIQIEARSLDFNSIMQVGMDMSDETVDHKLDAVYSDNTDLEIANAVSTGYKDNNLTEFKKYLENPKSDIQKYLGENGIVYSYNVKFDTYSYDPNGELVNTDATSLMSEQEKAMLSAAENNGFGDAVSPNSFTQMLKGTDGKVISRTVTDNYDMLYGQWPQKYNELVLVLNENNEIPVGDLYILGLLPSEDYREINKKMEAGEKIDISDEKWSYDDICEHTFKFVPACDYYEKDENTGFYKSVKDDNEALKELVNTKGEELKITAIIKLKEDASFAPISKTIGYTSALTDYIIEHTKTSPVVLAQQNSQDVNVLNGLTFEPDNDDQKIEDAKIFLNNLGITDKAALMKQMLNQLYATQPQVLAQMQQMDEASLAAALDEYLKNPEDDVLLQIYKAYISTGNYKDNMAQFGFVDPAVPSGVSIYVDSFEDKDAVTACIEDYNKSAPAEDNITYTDYVGLLMSSVTTIINVIAYVLVAFVSVSLIVSSIMIGIITYISVLERTKEIGILRAIGASKRNISQVFNAETFMVGLLSGLIGVGVTLLLLLPGNAIIHAFAGTTAVNATLPVVSAAVLVALSMLLTLIAGIIPSRKAAKKDPVIALRSE